jgi:hypothetical protein
MNSLRQMKGRSKVRQPRNIPFQLPITGIEEQLQGFSQAKAHEVCTRIRKYCEESISKNK